MRKNEETLSKLIQRFSRQPQYRERLYLAKIRVNWKEKMGKTLGEGVNQIYIRGRKVFLVVRSSVLKQELQMSKSVVLDRINEWVEEPYFEEVIIR